MDTICAISTPPGIGGIAVARISGPEATDIAQRIWKGKNLSTAPSHTAHLGMIQDPHNPGELLDQAVATVFRAPASFTGEDVVELAIHGSIYIQNALVNLLIRQGCRLAEAGEFTRRAFASGKMDLAEAEGVADLIASTSRAAHRVAMSQMRGRFSNKLAVLRDQLTELAALLELELDFSEEDVEFADRSHLLQLAVQTLDTVKRLADSFSTGDAIKRGIPVAIIGRPNAGKSSILNLLLGDNRAIVSDIPGTTRDTIEDIATIQGYAYRFIDTAGLRHTDDTIENLGINRAWGKTAMAKIVLWVLSPDTFDIPGTSAPNDPDASTLSLNELYTKLRETMSPDAHLLTILNKSDLFTLHDFSTLSNRILELTGSPPLKISAIHDTPDELSSAIHRITTATLEDTSDIIVTNSRHYEALHNAISPLTRVIKALQPTPYPIPSDLIAQDVRESIHHLSTITGSITTPDLLTHIFSHFCVGK